MKILKKKNTATQSFWCWMHFFHVHFTKSPRWMLILAKESWCELPCLLLRLKRFVYKYRTCIMLGHSLTIKGRFRHHPFALFPTAQLSAMDGCEARPLGSQKKRTCIKRIKPISICQYMRMTMSDWYRPPQFAGKCSTLKIMDVRALVESPFDNP